MGRAAWSSPRLTYTRLGCQDTGPGFFGGKENEMPYMPETLGVSDVQRAYEMGFRDAETAYDTTVRKALARYNGLRRALTVAAFYGSVVTVALIVAVTR
jgi:hypothetical protein